MAKKRGKKRAASKSRRQSKKQKSGKRKLARRAGKKKQKKPEIHKIDGEIGQTKEQVEAREKLNLAYEELYKRVGENKQQELTAKHIDDELLYIEKKFVSLKQKRRQQKAEKAKSRRQVQATRDHIFNLRKQHEREKAQNRKNLEKLTRQQSKLSKRAGYVGSTHGKFAKKYELSKLPPKSKALGEILQKCYSAQHSAIFTRPVDTLRYRNYLTLVKRPMCLDDVRENLFSGVYEDEKDFMKDMMQIWCNAQIYNPPHNQVHLWAAEFAHRFERECLAHGWRAPSKVQMIESSIRSPPRLTPKKKPEPPKVKPLTNAELNLIESNFLLLPEDKIEDIVAMLPVNEDEDEDDEVSIDIQSLSDELQRKILLIIKDHFNFDEKTMKGETIKSLTGSKVMDTGKSPRSKEILKAGKDGGKEESMATHQEENMKEIDEESSPVGEENVETIENKPIIIEPAAAQKMEEEIEDDPEEVEEDPEEIQEVGEMQEVENEDGDQEEEVELPIFQSENNDVVIPEVESPTRNSQVDPVLSEPVQLEESDSEDSDALNVPFFADTETKLKKVSPNVEKEEVSIPEKSQAQKWMSGNTFETAEKKKEKLDYFKQFDRQVVDPKPLPPSTYSIKEPFPVIPALPDKSGARVELAPVETESVVPHINQNEQKDLMATLEDLFD